MHESQLTFETLKRARKDNPDTSYEAAEKVVRKGTCLYWYRKIYAILRDNDWPQGHTAKEIAWLIAGPDWEKAHRGVWRRLKEMDEKGWIMRSEQGRESRIGGGKERMCWAVEGKEKEIIK